MEKTRKWRKILAMMLTVVMMLQNAQSVMVFADVTNEQIEQRLAGNQGQTEETQPAQSQVDTRANGEEYKTQSQETQENGNGSTDIGSPESGNATTEAKTSNADVSATITQSVFQADVSGTTCNFVQMTAQITNNDAENPATGVSVKALLNSAQLSWVKGYGTETAGAGAYAVDSNNTADLPDGSADGYDQIVMWTDQTIGAGETVAYQFAAQIIPASLDGVVNAWYVDGTSCSYTWENTEILVPTQAPVESTPEVAPPQAEPEEKPEVKPEETTTEVTEAPEEAQNYAPLLEFINASETREDDETFKNAVDMLFEELEKEEPEHFAVRQYKKYKLAAGKTAKSILISCGARLAPFDIAELREIMSYDEMELDMVGDQRTALFIIISDTDDTFNFVVAMMYSQLFNLLCDRADDVHHGRLPYHVRILCDEFANIGQIPKFDKLIATIRSREISASIILQSQSQLKTIYKDAAETILGNCDTMLFLGGKESSTLKEISETLGKETIDSYNTSQYRGQSESYGTNYQKLGKELKSQDELAVMNGGKCILQLRGVRPFLSDMFDIT